MTNKQELRGAAEKATQGKWRRASTRFNGITAQSAYPLCGKEDILANAAEKRDAEFIAAANPATVLALLDELEAAESLAKQQGNIAVALFDEVTTLRRNADDKAPELRSQLEEAEKRIAELEAREVALPQRLQPGADGYDDWYVHSADDGEYLKVDDVIASIRAAGIRINGEG